MQRCLEDSHLTPSEIGYINAHATSTPLGDRAEAYAISELFPNVFVSSIKGIDIFLLLLISSLYYSIFLGFFVKISMF